jgi:hypothetical protein
MSSGEVAEAVRAWGARRRLERAHLERWIALDDASAGVLLVVANHLRLRTGQLQSALGLLEEIALIDGLPVSAVLARPTLKRILEGTGSAPGRAHALVEELRAMRFPRLRRSLERMKAEIAALRLPPTVAVVLPRDLASDELQIEIRVRNGTEIESSLSALARSSDALGRLVELLGGGSLNADEV